MRGYTLVTISSTSLDLHLLNTIKKYKVRSYCFILILCYSKFSISNRPKYSYKLIGN